MNLKKSLRLRSSSEQRGKTKGKTTGKGAKISISKNPADIRKV
jgi:hypothetical protein